MLKSVLPIALILAVSFSSCSGKKEEEKKDEGNKEEKKEETASLKTSELNTITPNMLAVISISGMVCEINCVSSVKKLLTAMVGVTEIDIDFNSGNNVNKATVKYDNKQVNDRQMADAIEKLNDGAYKVESIDVKKLEEKTATVKKKVEEADVVSYSSGSGSSGFALPGILDVFDVL